MITGKSTIPRVFVAAVLMGQHLVTPAADADTSPFDGMWSVTLTCPPHNEDEDAKGYFHQFAGR